VSSTSIITPKNKTRGTETETSSRRLSECAELRTGRANGLRSGIARQREAMAVAAATSS
jgi:hypothetical protein